MQICSRSVQNCGVENRKTVSSDAQFMRYDHLKKKLCHHEEGPSLFRIKYKICTLTYKVIHTCQPVYLHNLLKPLNRTRNLRSSDDNQLVVPRVSSSKMGERAFSVAAPSSRIVSLLNLHSHFGKKLKLYISARLFHPKSSVPRHAGSTNWNGKRSMITSRIRICSASELGTPRI